MRTCVICQRPFSRRGNPVTCGLACSEQRMRDTQAAYRARHHERLLARKYKQRREAKQRR
jgi:hypothetical protein